MTIDNSSIREYSTSLIDRLFTILKLTNNASSEQDFENIEKYISALETELRGSLVYFSEYENGNQITSVLMKLSGIKNVTDYNVRAKAVKDSADIINRISKSIKDN